MGKKVYYTLTIIIISALLLNTTFANNSSSTNSDNNIIVSLNINYGQAVTQSNCVTLNLDVKGQDIELNSLQVQFSIDNKNWSGYNPYNNKWENGYYSSYQPFYSGFYIGYSSGLKTVYVKVIDSNGNAGAASAKINFSATTQNPYIINPQSTELNMDENFLNKAGIKGGSGSLYDPYIISNKDTSIVSKISNVAEVSYYNIEENNWSSWNKINSGQVNIPIVFDNIEGQKEVRIRTKNEYGVEGNSEIIYYILDYSKPIINLHTNYHSFIAVDGKLEFDLEIYDNFSNVIDFVIEVYFRGSSFVKEGNVKMYVDGSPTITTVEMDNLPKGKFKVKVTAEDKAGNKSTKQISVNSI